MSINQKGAESPRLRALQREEKKLPDKRKQLDVVYGYTYDDQYIVIYL